MYTCVCIYAHVCIHILCVYVSVFIHTHTHTHTHIYIYTYIHAYILCVCVYTAQTTFPRFYIFQWRKALFFLFFIEFFLSDAFSSDFTQNHLNTINILHQPFCIELVLREPQIYGGTGPVSFTVSLIWNKCHLRKAFPTVTVTVTGNLSNTKVLTLVTSIQTVKSTCSEPQRHVVYMPPDTMQSTWNKCLLRKAFPATKTSAEAHALNTVGF